MPSSIVYFAHTQGWIYFFGLVTYILFDFKKPDKLGAFISTQNTNYLSQGSSLVRTHTKLAYLSL
jgi:hypothetical protein